MEIEEVESVMEKIWDLHDKLSDAIHSISRAHYLTSITCVGKGSDDTFPPRCFANKKPSTNDDNSREGFVYVKDFPPADEHDSGIDEAKSLNAIRTALENLEDQLEFFHTVQTQQRAERDSAIARLEQSRIILAMRLGEHQGKKYRVIEEAQAFVGNVKDGNCFVTPENLFVLSESSPTKTQKGIRSFNPVKALISGFHCAQKTLKDQMGGLFGNAALIAISMLALLQLLKAGNGGTVLEPKRNVKRVTQSNNSPPFNANLTKLDVMLARG